MTNSYSLIKMLAITGLLLSGLIAGCDGGGEDGSDDGAAPPPPPATTLQSRLDQARQQSAVPGMAAATITSDAIAEAVSGTRKLGETAPIARSDLFHLGSNIKAMMATLVAILVESGQLRWDSTIAEVLPELAATMQTSYQRITLEQLLAHRGGTLAFTDSADLARLPSDLRNQLESNGLALVDRRLAFVDWLLQQPSPVTPGQDFLYSNAGYVVVAAMAERATAQAFEELLQQRLLSPLGLGGKFGWPASGNNQQPWGHEENDGKLQPNDPNALMNQFPAWLNPAGNISLSTDDYARFIQIHLRGLRGQAVLISAASYQKLHTPVGGPSEGDPSRFYALGWEVQRSSNGMISVHEGSAGTFDALAAIVPAQNRAVIVLANAFSEQISTAVTLFALNLLSSME